MASKGQKFKKYSSEQKEEILAKYFNNQGGYRSLAKQYDVPNKTIEGWVRKTKKNIDVTVDNRGYPKGKKRGQIDYKERYEILKKYQVFLEARRGKK